MPRMTKKYQKALERAGIIQRVDSAALYRALNAENWFWNAASGTWEKRASAKKPTDLVRIRVWTATSKIEKVADDVVKELLNSHY